MMQSKLFLTALLVIVSFTATFASNTFAIKNSTKSLKVRSLEVKALEVGAKAPMFAGVDDNEKKWDSKEKIGKKILVVYFYPADMTGGCTKQACSYRDALSQLKRKDVEVIGISGDTVENHQHFKNKYKLNFTLLADTEGKIAEQFGVKAGKGGSLERKIDGEMITFDRGVTTSRWTFVIDKDWRIVHKNTKVNAAKDSESVLKVLQKMK